MRLSTRCNIQFTLGLFANYFSLKSLSLSLKSHMLRCQPWLNLCINLDNFIRRRLTDHNKIISPILRTTVAKIVKTKFHCNFAGESLWGFKAKFLHRLHSVSVQYNLQIYQRSEAEFVLVCHTRLFECHFLVELKKQSEPSWVRVL